MEQNNKIVLFEAQQIRRTWHNETWYYSVIDVIAALTDSSIPSRYWNDVKRRVEKESGNSELYAKCVKLKFDAADGKNRATDCANTETMLRIIMSIPSPKAEPFKQWLAETGQERIEEVENPELGFDRLTEIYKAKGYSDEWIKNRLQSIETRKQLTDEWKKRGVKEGQEYSILTATIAKGTFGLTPSEHADLKELKKQNLRDHMTPFELIFTALSEEATRSLAVQEDAQGFMGNQEVAHRGGTAAGNARRNFEKETGLNVVSPKNFLHQLDENKEEMALKEGKTE